MSVLQVARDFGLPLDLVTEATAIVATRGAGKSSASAVVTEEAFELGVQVVIFDRTGVYWGLRSNAKGDGPGLGVYVLGGPHGDVPLEPHAGVLIADLVVDSGHSFILDLSDFSKAAAIGFAADMLERLYDRKARARSTTLLVIDEAHFYAPQTPRGGFKGNSARLMGAMEDVVGLGRSRGLGAVLTTQRTQALNKAILDLIETLFVMRMLSPRARDAVQDWIREKQEDDREGVIGTLDSLPTGTAWVWAPLRGLLRKIAIRRIHTFDSYDTPKPGQTRVEPSARRELDLDALGEQMRNTAERAKADDPKELRQQIASLKRELAQRPTEPVREVPVLDKWTAERLAIGAGSILEAAKQLRELGEGIAADLRRISSSPGRSKNLRSADATLTKLADPDTSPSVAEAKQVDSGLRKGERKMLTVIAQRHPERISRVQLGTLAGFVPRGGTFRTYFGTLKRKGFVEDQGVYGIQLTQAGLDYLGELPAPQSTQELVEMWRRALRQGERAMLDQLVARGTEPLTRDELGELAGFDAGGGTFRTYLGTLRRNGLADVDGDVVRASETLFLNG